MLSQGHTGVDQTRQRGRVADSARGDFVDVNDRRMVTMARKVVAACDGSIAGKRIAVLGLTYKPGTDDMREAPSLVIVPELQAAGAQIVAYDPVGVRSARSLLPRVQFAETAYDCVEGAHAAVIITEWDEFRELDLKRVRAALMRPIMVDLRNIYSIEIMKALGFRYICIGRGLRGEGERLARQAERERSTSRLSQGAFRASPHETSVVGG